MMTPERLRAIKERCERATEGPWAVAPNRHKGKDGRSWGKIVAYLRTPTGGIVARTIMTWDADNGPADAEFAAHAREDVPALVAEVERLQELKDDYRLRIEHMATALGLIQDEAEALERAVQAAKGAGGAERLDEIAKHVQAILDVLGRV